MRLRVHKAYADAPRATISLPRSVRDGISRASGIEVRPGYAAWVEGSPAHCPRNLIVQRMRRDDALVNTASCRIGRPERERLGIDVGDKVEVTALKYEVYYHGTRAPNPLESIVRGKWIVGMSGQGVWMSDLLQMAQGYVRTGLLTLEVAWGEQLTWPLPAHLQRQFDRWCREHGVEPGSVPDSNWGLDQNLLRWARLYGHYFVPYANARIFPGVYGSSFKGNRLRIVRLVDPAGNVLFQRGGQPT